MQWIRSEQWETARSSTSRLCALFFSVTLLNFVEVFQARRAAVLAWSETYPLVSFRTLFEDLSFPRLAIAMEAARAWNFLLVFSPARFFLPLLASAGRGFRGGRYGSLELFSLALVTPRLHRKSHTAR